MPSDDAASRLATDRAARNAARAVVDANLAQVKADLAARSIGGRVADKAKGDALDFAGQAVNVARESKGIIAAAIGALALWTLRGPLTDFARARFRPAPVQDDTDSAGQEPSVEESEA